MQLRVPDTMSAGSTVKCPKCNGNFQVPMVPGSPPSPEPPRPAPPSEFSAQPSAPPPNWATDQERFDGPRDPSQRSARHGLEGLSSDYRVDLGEYFSSGMQHYGTVLGQMVGYGFILVGVMLALACFAQIPILGLVFSCGSLLMELFVNFALYAGFAVVCLLHVRGQRWEFNDFWGGFRYWVPLFINRLVQIAIYMVCLLPGIALIIVFAIVQEMNQPGPGQFQPTVQFVDDPFAINPGPRPIGRPAPPPPDFTFLILGVGVMLLGLLAFLYFYIRCFLFAPWLIIDRGCSGIEAIQGNWIITRGHFWGWFGVSFVLGLIFVAGSIPCYLGLPFVFPIYYLVMTAAWMRITGNDPMTGMH